MSRLYSKIDRALISEANEPKGPVIIDINDQRERMQALKNSRAPCIGWEDYIAGRDYEPPTYYTTTDVPYGPKDTMGNPHSDKYGGVRPWSIDEVMATLIWPSPERMPYPDEDRDTIGILWIIARKPKVMAAFRANYRTYDKWSMEEAVSLGAAAAYRAIFGDEGRVGVRFTSFIGQWIETGMRDSIPPGFQNEYRFARGLIRRWADIGRGAARVIAAGRPVERIVNELNAEIEGIDKKPGPNNKSMIIVGDATERKEVSLGYLVDDLLEVLNELLMAVESGDQQEVLRVVDNLEKKKEQIADTEDIYTTYGPKTGGSVISKPKDEKTLPVSSITVKSKKSDDEQERSDIRPTETPYSYLYGPEVRDALEQAIRMVRYGVGSGKSWYARRAKHALEQLDKIIEYFENPTGIHKYKIVRKDNGFDIVDEISDDVLGWEATKEDAEKRIDDLTSNRAIKALDAIRSGLGDDYGEFVDEIRYVVYEIAETAKRRGSFDSVKDEITDLKQVADEDIAAGDEKIIATPISEQEYRIILRLYGIRNYPERGTIFDPEIDDRGNLSNWARNGYPQLSKNTDIQEDLWTVERGVRKNISAARVSTIRKSALAKFEPILKRLGDKLSEEGVLNRVDAELLYELRVQIGRMIIAETKKIGSYKSISECKFGIRH